MAKKISKIIGFIGAGNMAEALIKGMLQKKITIPDNIHASDVRPERLTQLKEETGINISSRNISVLEASDILILAVKPQQIKTILDEISNQTESKVIVSIVAGVSSEVIKNILGPDTDVVRVMPNTPALIGEAMTALAFSVNVSDKNRSVVRAVFESVGRIAEVREDQMNLITALSGSGPAYVFRLAEELIRAGEKLGLAADLAKELILQTILGSAKLLAESSVPPEELRKKVTSPGGTTEAGMSVMDQKDFSGIILETVKNAAKRTDDLSKLNT